ncbi:MAG: hypothetical protein KGI60_01050 [Patescibacteria group bacterium]|nr:hypothetical protein [Patescibacteria group bacterium]
MKHIRWIVAGLLALAMPATAFAQSTSLNRLAETNQQQFRSLFRESEGLSDSDWKFEVTSGMVRRYFASNTNAGLNLNMFMTDYQLGVQMKSKRNELEFAIAGGHSNGKVDYFTKTVDKGDLVAWNSYLLIANVPVTLKYQEDLRLWDFKVNYWRTLGQEAPMHSFAVGIGPRLYILQKTTKVEAEYADYGSEVTILSQHYQSSQSQNTYLIPGLTIGGREKLKISRNRNLGSIALTGAYVFAKPVSEAKVANQSLPTFSNLAFSASYVVQFE